MNWTQLPKTAQLYRDLRAAQCRRWGLFANLQYAEMRGTLLRCPTIEEYNTMIAAKGAL